MVPFPCQLIVTMRSPFTKVLKVLCEPYYHESNFWEIWPIPLYWKLSGDTFVTWTSLKQWLSMDDWWHYVWPKMQIYFWFSFCRINLWTLKCFGFILFSFEFKSFELNTLLSFCNFSSFPFYPFHRRVLKLLLEGFQGKNTQSKIIFSNVLRDLDIFALAYAKFHITHDLDILTADFLNVFLT